MNKHERYVEVCKQMELLSIVDVSTQRQKNNDTRVWRLPIKNKWKNGSFIEVASFTTGYVRNQNSGYSNYQLNKRCESEPEYYQLANGDYRKYTTRTCKLIPNEIDRLEYLIAYCLKNYYIKNANQVAEGVYVSKWEHEYEMNGLQNKLANSVPKWKYDEVTRWKQQDCGHYDRIQDLESEVRGLETKYQASQAELDEAQSTYGNNSGAMGRIQCLENTIKNLHNKLETISRRLDVTKSIADNG